MSDRKNLAALTNGPTRRQAIVGVAMAFGGLTVGSTKAWAGAEEEISRTAESIHQEAEISREVGGAFTLFGGYITGATRRACAERANRAGLANGRLGSGRLLDCEI